MAQLVSGVTLLPVHAATIACLPHTCLGLLLPHYYILYYIVLAAVECACGCALFVLFIAGAHCYAKEELMTLLINCEARSKAQQVANAAGTLHAAMRSLLSSVISQSKALRPTPQFVVIHTDSAYPRCLQVG